MATAAKATDTAPASPAATSASPKRYERIGLDQIAPDPNQPRKTFDEAELAELADSIKVHDVIVPIEVRELPDKLRDKKQYILIAGERRWRAAKLAGKADIPALVETRKLAPEEILERQLLENSFRADVPPLEEAETYQRLMKQFGYTMDKLIAKTKKSKAHLYGRLKLLELCDGAKKALQAGKLQPAIAELVARIPDKKMQEQATKDVLGEGKSYSYDLQPERIEDDQHRNREYQPLSFRAAMQLIRRRYHTQFDLLKFDPADKTLVAKVGACTDCPHRAGNQPMLPGMAPSKGLDDDHCTNAPCFEAKVKATFVMKAELAKGKGLKVIEGGAAKKIFSSYGGGAINHDANYADPKAELPYNIARPGSSATWGGLLGKKLEEVPRVIVEDPNTGAARELLVKDKAIEMLRQLGKIDKPDKKSPSTLAAEKRQKEQKKKDRAEHELRQAAFSRFLDQVLAGAAKDAGNKEAALWRWLAHGIGAYLSFPYGTDDLFRKRRELESMDEFCDLVATCKTGADARALVAELLVAVIAETVVDDYMHKEDKAYLETAEKLFGASWQKSLAAAKEAAKAEAKSDAAKDAKKTPAKKGGAK